MMRDIIALDIIKILAPTMPMSDAKTIAFRAYDIADAMIEVSKTEIIKSLTVKEYMKRYGSDKETDC